MNIMVFNVPAETVGALSILNDFYKEIKQSKYNNIKWVFVLSKPMLDETELIKVLNFPWIKKSWFHRLYFDNIIAPRLIKRYNADKIISFQNVIVPHVKAEQVLYMQNSLSFVDYKFNFKDNKLLWVYQNIIGRIINRSIKKASNVIVQSKWIKNACVEKTNIPEDKVIVIPPKINLEIHKYFEPKEEAFNTFFYPASGFEYKNHKIIIEACKELKNQGISDFHVIFTLKGNENEYVSKIHKEVKDNELPIEFVGSLSREQVFNFYTRTILLFPSYIETYGLPLLEARLHGGVILASDCPFSHEILNSYENVYYFNPFDVNKIFVCMKKMINKEVNYINTQTDTEIDINQSWEGYLYKLTYQEGD